MTLHAHIRRRQERQPGPFVTRQAVHAHTRRVLRPRVHVERERAACREPPGAMVVHNPLRTIHLVLRAELACATTKKEKEQMKNSRTQPRTGRLDVITFSRAAIGSRKHSVWSTMD